jgi:hypothetical protein
MRIKTLLCAAGIAALAIPAMAQTPVYSLNVVGYVNLQITNGFNMVANQFDYDGTGTNNTLGTVFGSNLTAGSAVYGYNAGSFVLSTYLGNGKWSGSSNVVNASMNPGNAFWLKSFPAGATNVTLVGNVYQGTNVQILPLGFQFVAAVPPISGGLQGVLGYKPNGGDATYQYNAISRSYTLHTCLNPATTNWSNGGQPVPAVGEGFWLKVFKATNWVQSFTVQ